MLPTWGTYRHPGRLHGARRKREDSNGTVHYLGGYERKLAGGSNSPEAVTKYYSASFGALSRPLAFRRGGTLHWLGADHLGGTIRVLDSSFTALDRMRYKPYGEDRDTGSSLNTDRKFTGQTEDEAAGLYWYASRAYDPEIGRFVSPDILVPDRSNPQSLNRYAYVRNNPLKFIDPSGHSAEWFSQTWVDDFIEDHGREPNGMDRAFRYHSMQAASQGQDFSVENWRRILERASRNKRSQTYYFPQKALYHNKEQLDAYYNLTIEPRPPERHYYVRRLDGTTITVREYVRGWRFDHLKRLGAQAAVLTPLEIWSQGELDYASKLYLHEEQHVNQMQEKGEVWFKASYFGEFAFNYVTTGFDRSEAHRIHSMEVDANRRAGLPDYWRQSKYKDRLAP